MSDHKPMFPLGRDETPYRLLTADFVSTESFNGEEILKVDPRALTCSPRKR